MSFPLIAVHCHYHIIKLTFNVKTSKFFFFFIGEEFAVDTMYFKTVSHLFVLLSRCPSKMFVLALLSAQPETTADSQLHLWRHQPDEQLRRPLPHPHPHRSERCVGVFSLMHDQVFKLLPLFLCFIASLTHLFIPIYKLSIKDFHVFHLLSKLAAHGNMITLQ